LLITAGPTREKIDDVRYISNYSSGKMGFAIAEAALLVGCEVYLVYGPVNIQAPDGAVLFPVESAEEMYLKSMELFSEMNFAVLSAAVADYQPSERYNGKMKKESLGDEPVINLKKTKDILASLGKIKRDNQILCGFALESENLLENAARKMKEKNCDLIVANKAGVPDSGFGGDYNTITILENNGNVINYLPMLKKQAGFVILSKIAELCER